MEVTLKNDGVLDEAQLRQLAVGIVKYATNSENGRVLGDPIFDQITENRAGSPTYSGCADEAHFMLSRLGLKDPTLINRNDTTEWVSGVNVSKLRYGGAKLGAWIDWKPGLLAKPGDVLIMGNDNASTHVCVVLEHTAGALLSCDYGQFHTKEGKYWNELFKPAGNMTERSMKIMLGGIYTGDPVKANWRKIMGWLDISKFNYPDTIEISDEIYNGYVVNPYA